jgi:hypothetical protein
MKDTAPSSRSARGKYVCSNRNEKKGRKRTNQAQIQKKEDAPVAASQVAAEKALEEFIYAMQRVQATQIVIESTSGNTIWSQTL